MRCMLKIILTMSFMVSGCQVQAACLRRFTNCVGRGVHVSSAQLPVFGKNFAKVVALQTLQTLILGAMQGYKWWSGSGKSELPQIIPANATWCSALCASIKSNLGVMQFLKLYNYRRISLDYGQFVQYDDDDLIRRRCYKADEPERFARLTTGPRGNGQEDPSFIPPLPEAFGCEGRRQAFRFAEEVAADVIMASIARAVNLEEVNRVIDSSSLGPVATFGLKVALGTGMAVTREGIRRFVLHSSVEFGARVRRNG